MSDTNKTLQSIIIPILGVEEEEILANSDFFLDLNATPTELEEMISEIEEEFSIELPFSVDGFPETYQELLELVEDLCL